MWKKARIRAGLSREEAAWRLHIGGRTLYDYETGKTLVPPVQDFTIGMDDRKRKHKTRLGKRTYFKGGKT